MNRPLSTDRLWERLMAMAAISAIPGHGGGRLADAAIASANSKDSN